MGVGEVRSGAEREPRWGGSEENGWTENGEINFWLDFQSGLNSLRPPPRVSTALLRVIEYRSILSPPRFRS